MLTNTLRLQYKYKNHNIVYGNIILMIEVFHHQYYLVYIAIMMTLLTLWNKFPSFSHLYHVFNTIGCTFELLLSY